jgi:hypothetical protein
MSEEIQWHVQAAPNFIAQHLNLQQKLREKNKSRIWKLEWNTKQNKNYLQLSFVLVL